jgi:hypothetical protein
MSFPIICYGVPKQCNVKALVKIGSRNSNAKSNTGFPMPNWPKPNNTHTGRMSIHPKPRKNCTIGEVLINTFPEWHMSSRPGRRGNPMRIHDKARHMPFKKKKQQQHALNSTVATDTSSSNTAAEIRRGFAPLAEPSSSISMTDEAIQLAMDAGFNCFQATLTSGGDDRCMILPETQRTKYHIPPIHMSANAVFRGSCTCNPPTLLGYEAAQALFHKISQSANPHDTVVAVLEQQRQRIATLFWIDHHWCTSHFVSVGIGCRILARRYCQGLAPGPTYR